MPPCGFYPSKLNKTSPMAVLAEVEQYLGEEGDGRSLSFSENPAAKGLLDIIVSILSEEYIRTAKENPEIFSK